MEESINDYLKSQLGIERVNPKLYSPLALAYVGDSVYDTIIRTMLVSKSNMQVNKYHKHAISYVKAEAQASIIVKIEGMLTEEEVDIYKRGRNAKSHTTAKNAKTIDYRMATGFEALIGYLYLKEDYVRLIDLIRAGIVEDEL